MREMLERRYRFNVRQVLVAVEESTRASAAAGTPAGKATASSPAGKNERERSLFIAQRLENMQAFFSVLDAGIAAFTQGQPVSPEVFQNLAPLARPRPKGR
jgi:hypothetical protein